MVCSPLLSDGSFALRHYPMSYAALAGTVRAMLNDYRTPEKALSVEVSSGDSLSSNSDRAQCSSLSSGDDSQDRQLLD